MVDNAHDESNKKESKDQPVEEKPKEEPVPQLSEKELLLIQRLKEESKNPYIAPLNKKLKALGKKLKNIEKIEQLKKTGKELNSSQTEALNGKKTTEKELAFFEDLKKGYLQAHDQVCHSPNNQKKKKYIYFFNLLFFLLLFTKIKIITK